MKYIFFVQFILFVIGEIKLEIVKNKDDEFEGGSNTQYMLYQTKEELDRYCEENFDFPNDYREAFGKTVFIIYQVIRFLGLYFVIELCGNILNKFNR